ncbi:MAG TPA: arginine--tRNA ligase [Gaiellaceae bacterium]|nr:arginine--tRNA ligase [Gaiellaceae bacterium]
MSETTRTALVRLQDELARVAGAPVVLERPTKAEHGDYATNVALRLAGARKRPPLEIAAELARAAASAPGVERAETAPPGFLNLWLSPAWYGDALAEMLAAGGDYGGGSAGTARERVQVEMVSANPTGPITVASARNGAYGDSVARLLAFAGHEVEREYYYNDGGTQMELFRASVAAARRGEEPPEGGYGGDYVRELAAGEGDPVERTIELIDASLERFRIRFDGWSRQTEVEPEIADALAALPTYQRDGAIWVRTSELGDDKDRVAIRASGEPTYFAFDAAYIRRKLARFDRAVYVLGADHHGYVARLKALARGFGADPDRIDVLIYQLVHLTRGGEATKMSKRRGDVVTLDELVDEIGVDAARWYLVDRGPDRSLEIDVDLAKERSRKNPVYYVQYVHARTAGIFREAGAAQPDPVPTHEPDGEERNLVKRLAEFPRVAAEATERRAPQLVTDFAIRLADDFHRFYHDRSRHQVVGSPEQAFRLALMQATRSVIARCLDLVGVAAPDRM